MAEQRQGFRFRFPWQTAAAPPPPPPPPPPRPTTRAPASTQPTTTATAAIQPTPAPSAQRQPFRPAGSAPVPPPPASTRTESQPPSPARVGTQSRVSSQPSSPAQSRPTAQPSSSPSRPTTQSRATSQPSSPSRPTTQSRASGQPSSPSRVTPQPRPASRPSSPLIVPPPSSPSRVTPQPRPASRPSSPLIVPQTQPAPQPPSPSRLAPQPAGQTPSPPPSATPMQPTPGAVTQPPSPPKKLEPTTPKSPPLAPTTTMPPPSASPEEPMPAKSQTEPKEPQQPMPETLPTNVPITQSQGSAQTTIQPLAATASTTPPTPKLESPIISAKTKPLPESVEKLEETKKGQEGKTNGGATEEPEQRATTEPLTITSSSNAPAKEQPTVAFQAEQKQPEKKVILDTKEVLETRGSAKKQEMTSPLKDKTTVSESRPKPSLTHGERGPLLREIKDDISKLLPKTATWHTKHPMDDKPLSVISLAGENRGASMQLGSDSTKREMPIHIHRGYKLNPNESADATTTDGEGSSRGGLKDARTTKEEATKTYVNSNTQGINNSIVFNSSVNEQNPGIHLDITHNPQPTKPNNRTGSSLDTHKAEIRVTPAQKLTYEPTVRRRCLRGLFMESSDSDPDNPDKPRRHGCRYSCTEKSTKDNDIDVL